MTKRFGAEIIIDGPTRSLLKGATEEHALPEFRVRRLACVRPAGFETAFEIHQLMPASGNVLSEEQIVEYEAALDRFSEGKNEDAIRRLAGLPPGDGPTQTMIQCIQAGQCPGGVIDLPK